MIKQEFTISAAASAILNLSCACSGVEVNQIRRMVIHIDQIQLHSHKCLQRIIQARVRSLYNQNVLAVQLIVEQGSQLKEAPLRNLDCVRVE